MTTEKTDHADSASVSTDGLAVFRWEPATGPWNSGNICCAGKWPVGGVHYDSSRNRGDPKKYAATCRLPGLKNLLGHYETEDEAKARVERVAMYWLANLTTANA